MADDVLTEEARREGNYAVQRYLRALHLAGEPIPLINPDGIYGPETRRAVEAFQRLYGLPVTGRVDFATWELLKSKAEQAEREVSAVEVFAKEDFPLTPGQHGGEIYQLQALLRRLAMQYGNIGRVEMTGTLDAQTMREVARLQRILGEEPTGIPDRAMWERIVTSWVRSARQQ